jgi:uncharacterized protein (DUF433 family)
MQQEFEKNTLLQRITINPIVMVGKPVIRGTRLTVEHLLKAMAGGLTFEQLQDDYPFLEKDDLRACLLYASLLVGQEKIYQIAA